MDQSTKEFLASLEASGLAYDAVTSDHSRKMLNITADTGEFLTVLVCALKPSTILEIGTSNGYSTIWLAAAARDVGGRVTTIESAREKIDLAASNFSQSNVADVVDQVEGDATHAISVYPDESIDFIFLDADRSQYSVMWSDMARILRPGGLMVIDNAVSHAKEMAPLVAMIGSDPAFVSSLVPVGKGELLVVKR